jgi:hypothetical protein
VPGGPHRQVWATGEDQAEHRQTETHGGPPER